MGFNKIKVVVRVRPFLDEELKIEERAINTSMKIRETNNEIEYIHSNINNSYYLGYKTRINSTSFTSLIKF